MSKILILSTILINLALIFYSIGVWAERFSKYLKKWHVIVFWVGFTFDVLGNINGKVKCSKVLNEPQHWRE